MEEDSCFFLLKLVSAIDDDLYITEMSLATYFFKEFGPEYLEFVQESLCLAPEYLESLPASLEFLPIIFLHTLELITDRNIWAVKYNPNNGPKLKL